MRLKRYFVSFLCSLLLFTYLPVVSAEEVDSTTPIENSEDTGESSSNGVVNSYNTDSFNEYYNYYYENTSDYDDVDLVSLNNKDTDAYWRPKYEDLSIPLQEYITTKDKNVQMKTNGFDVDWSTVDKKDIDTSRALEKLGYDFLLYKETIANTGEGAWDNKVDNYSYSVERETGFDKPITAPYFIMNAYKSLGIDLYNVYFQYKEETPEVGAYITRTDPKSYWRLFLNDHPIDYEVYDDNNVEDITAGRILTTADAITILAQMLDFYGEPIISKQEEYLLLQVYGNDVPTTLTDNQKVAWSYLKSRGIIPEEELNYNQRLTFTDMMDLLMRASDKDSRVNFKEIQITTTLDDSFIQNGYYQTDVKINNKPKITPIESSISFASATRYDFLIEMDDSIAFRFKDNQKLNRSIFISKGPLSTDKAISGSVYHGIINGKYYHFTVPVSELEGISTLYVNSSNNADYPANYHIPISKGKVGGVYSEHGELSSEDTITFSSPQTFESTYPETLYVDEARKTSGVVKTASAASYDLTVNYRFEVDLLDVQASIKAITKLGGTASLSADQKYLNVSVNSSAIGGTPGNTIRASADEVAARLVINSKYMYTSNNTTAILGLTGSRLLIPLDEAKAINMIDGYKLIPNEDTLVIYTKDKDIVFVNNKNKIIQKGNTYLQVKEGPSLFTQTENNGYLVDFRALYGSKEFGFTTEPDPTTGELIVNFYNNAISEENTGSSSYRVNEYTYFPTHQYLPYETYFNITTTKPVDVLYKLKSSLVANKADEVTEVLLPFSSTNTLGNYLIYGEYDENTGYEKYYLVMVTPTGIPTSKITSDGDYKSMFLYHPSTIKDKEYTVDVVELNSKSESKYGIKQVPGVGWVYKLKEIENTQAAKKTFMADYRKHTNLLPFAISYDNRTPMLYNFNINYFNEDMTKNLTAPVTGKTYSPIPAAVSIQSWFTNPAFVSHISKTAILSKTKDTELPLMYFGTMPVKADLKNKALTTSIGGLNVGNYTDISLTGMNTIEKLGSTYSNPGIYYITSGDLDVTLSTTKNVVEETEIDRRSAKLQAFFDKYSQITFMDLIHGVDNGMSILFYIITRVVPLIILCLLTLMLMISMVADMKIVQLFCTRVFDPVKVLTFGNHNIMTVRNKYLVLSLIGALTLMGIIQAGNLEKIVMFFVRAYYAIMMFFE